MKLELIISKPYRIYKYYTKPKLKSNFIFSSRNNFYGFGYLDN